jgi:hypothetical protein
MKPVRTPTYQPYDYADGLVRHVTLADARRLVRLACRVAREAVAADVIEEARRLTDKLKVAAHNKYKAEHLQVMRARRAAKRAGGQHDAELRALAQGRRAA